MKRRQGAGGTTRFIARSKIPELAKAKPEEAEGLGAAEAADADEDEDDMTHAVLKKTQGLYPGGYYICFLKGFRVAEKRSAGRQCGQ